MNSQHLQRDTIYKYCHWPFECDVKLLKKMVRSTSLSYFEFKIVGRVTCHDEAETRNMSDIFQINELEVSWYIIDPIELITTIEDLHL